MNKRQKLKKKEINRKEINQNKTSKLERLSKKILFSFPKQDFEGKIYVNFCSYYFHQGIIGDQRFQEKKCYQCFYYLKLKEE